MMLIRAAFPLLACLYVGPALAQSGGEARQPPSITVEGRASVEVVPDIAVISLGVVTERPHAADAVADNSRATQVVLDAVKAEGIDPKDIATASVELNALYDQATRGTPKITGFRATNILQIRVRPIDRAGVLAGKLIDKGVNSIDGIDFVASPDAKREDQLRADAARDARHKAEVYTEALGVKLGRVLSIVPNGEQPLPAPRVFKRFATAELAAAPPPVPLAAGTQDHQAEVSVTFELMQ